eukprot:scaffold661579_cov57-Prasinocladus_malaysianus.AAC.1
MPSKANHFAAKDTPHPHRHKSRGDRQCKISDDISPLLDDTPAVLCAHVPGSTSMLAEARDGDLSSMEAFDAAESSLAFSSRIQNGLGGLLDPDDNLFWLGSSELEPCGLSHGLQNNSKPHEMDR